MSIVCMDFNGISEVVQEDGVDYNHVPQTIRTYLPNPGVLVGLRSSETDAACEAQLLIGSNWGAGLKLTDRILSNANRTINSELTHGLEHEFDPDDPENTIAGFLFKSIFVYRAEVSIDGTQRWVKKGIIEWEDTANAGTLITASWVWID